MSEHLFRPRINNKLMDPAYYDHSYIPTGVSGGNMANPYVLNYPDSINPFERESAYIWGRWHEGGTYGNRIWSCNANLGYILEYINTQINSRYYYGYYDEWYDATMGDYTDPETGDDYHYLNTDSIIRVGRFPTKVGQIVIFMDDWSGSLQDYHYWRAGVVEYLEPTGNYYFSTIDAYAEYGSDYNKVLLLNNPNGVWYPQEVANRRLYPRFIDNYYSTLPDPEGSWPIRVGKPIGWKPLPLLFSKKYNDQRRGLILDGPC